MLSSIESLSTIMEQCFTYQYFFSGTASVGGMTDVASVVGAGSTCTHFVRHWQEIIARSVSIKQFEKTKTNDFR